MSLSGSEFTDQLAEFTAMSGGNTEASPSWSQYARGALSGTGWAVLLSSGALITASAISAFTALSMKNEASADTPTNAMNDDDEEDGADRALAINARMTTQSAPTSSTWNKFLIFWLVMIGIGLAMLVFHLAVTARSNAKKIALEDSVKARLAYTSAGGLPLDVDMF